MEGKEMKVNDSKKIAKEKVHRKKRPPKEMQRVKER
jgi:hypothetical protein